MWDCKLVKLFIGQKYDDQKKVNNVIMENQNTLSETFVHLLVL